MSELPRVTLAHLPTPLEPAPRFSAEMTGVDVWIKRDDCTGLAFGGNKPRKLEFLMAAAQEAGADTVVTFGGVQSNHTRCTAAAARRLGMDCHLILAGSPPEEVNGNLLLDRLLGATLTFMPVPSGGLTPAGVAGAFAKTEETLRSRGRKPFLIAAGGSMPLGLLGYRTAFDEMMSQARETGLGVTRLVVAVGTGGTLAGLVLGNILAGRPLRITGISVAPPPGLAAAVCIPPVEQLVAEGAALLGREAPVREGDVSVLYDYAGPAYAVPTTEGIEAIRSLAHTEGIFLEPVYTAKAMAGLIGLCRSGGIARDEKVIFLHTGGTPALFSYSKALAR